MATAHADHGTETHHDHRETRHSPIEVAKLVISGMVVLALVLFGVVNADDVSVDYLVGSGQVPLILVILGSAVAGALVAALVRRRRS